MDLPAIKNLYNKLNSFQIWGIYILLFIISLLISQHFTIQNSYETSFRLSVGFVFFIYVISPVKNWIYILPAQLLLTYLLSFMINNESSLNISAETFTSLLSAATYKLLIKKISHYRYINFNLILPFSAGFGSLAGGLSIHFFSEYFMPSGFHSNLWITWTLSSMIGILLIPNLNFRWKTLDIKAFFITQKKHFIELFFLIITTLIFTNLIYSNKITIINLSINFPYLLLPLIFWAAIRFNPVILSLLLFIETISILQYIKPVIGTNIESGFPYYSIINSFQIFILFTIEFSYLMAQIIVTRNLAQEKIKKLNENLEASVNRRTTELKQALEALGQSEEQFREAFETAMYGMALVRLDGSFIRVNQAFCDMIGYEKTKLISSNFQKITYKQDYNIERNKFRKLIAGSIFFYQIEKRIIHRDQLAVWVLTSNSLITSSEGTPLRIVSQIIDITERKQSENQLKKYSETLTILLKEVNHRVKNNLSALIGMLHLEEDKAETGGKAEYISLVKDLTSRIQGLATVHSMLSAINWRPLELKHLCEQIIQSVITGLPVNQTFILKITPSLIKINSNQSHHLAIVLNELATNSVKYGFSSDNEGSIEVHISQSKGVIHIRYKDNGPGYPEHLLNGDFTRLTIGLELIRGIITQSLDGEFKLFNNDGAVIDIWFLNELS